MVALSELVHYTNQLLSIRDFADYCPNGLQVQGSSKVARLVAGVTACQALLEAAAEVSADAVLVHHGYFWKGEDSRVVGIKRQRLKTLLSHDMSLLAYHLPLDAHSNYGNNVQLGKILSLDVEMSFAIDGGPSLGLIGKPINAITGAQFEVQVGTLLQRNPLYIPGKAPSLKRIAWCTGAAQSFITAAVEHQVDAFLTGEVSEQTVHIARETGIHFYAAGHHVTERYGVQALGEHLAQHFELEFRFIDIDNPV
jgi:dinuclear metal center YbgI/SA1388 family protein